MDQRTNEWHVRFGIFNRELFAIISPAMSKISTHWTLHVTAEPSHLAAATELFDCGILNKVPIP